MGLITKKKKTTEEIKVDLLKVEKNLSELERRMNRMFFNLVGEDTWAEDIARHEAKLTAFGRHDISTTMCCDEEIASLGAFLQEKLRQKFVFPIDVFSAFDARSLRWIIKADTPYSVVTQDFTREAIDSMDWDEVLKFFIDSIEKTTPTRFRRKVEVSLPVKTLPTREMRLFRCECCNAVLTSTTCEYCGAKYFIN